MMDPADDHDALLDSDGQNKRNVNPQSPNEGDDNPHDGECDDDNAEEQALRVPLVGAPGVGTVARRDLTPPRAAVDGGRQPKSRAAEQPSTPAPGRDRPSSAQSSASEFRSRKKTIRVRGGRRNSGRRHSPHRDRQRRAKRRNRSEVHSSLSVDEMSDSSETKRCCDNKYTHHIVQSTLTLMNFLAKVLLYGSIIATVAGVVWYSLELKNNGTDPHLIAWFSAGAFVLLGFPISIYGIIMHLSNYYRPNIQCYVVRILWMVPLYSIESWLCLRFHKYAIYIETLRDCYESYVLYCFFQYLIEVLGGEEALVLMLKDKSPTRGMHMWGMHCCLKPWLMGQPVSRRTSYGPLAPLPERKGVGGGGGSAKGLPVGVSSVPNRAMKRVRWTSPFFVKCKLGVLQYVILKFVSSIFVMVLEIYGLYKEGDFTPKGGYLYICILTNTSQCWALYCLIFFYYATKNELGPIRPVGKFLSVKALVFFTWWQSVGISILYNMGFIPHYTMSTTTGKDGAGVGDGAEGSVVDDWSSEDVAKGLQDYLICIEMFIGAIVHTFVFPHTDYLAPLGRNGEGILSGKEFGGGGKRLGRKGRPWNAALMHQYHRRGDDRSDDSVSKSSAFTGEYDLEGGSASAQGSGRTSPSHPMETLGEGTNVELVNAQPSAPHNGNFIIPLEEAPTEVEEEEQGDDTPLVAVELNEDDLEEESVDTSRGSAGSIFSSEIDDSEHQHPDTEQQRPGFVRALLDSTIPRDVIDNSVGVVRGDYNVEKKTLLHHAATSDEYDLFSKQRRAAVGRPRTAGAAREDNSGARVVKSAKEQQ